MAMVIFPFKGCNLQVAGQNWGKKCPEQFTDLPKLLIKQNITMMFW